MEITIDKLLKIYKPNIVDIRGSIKYSDNHIIGAINIPYELLMSNYSKYLNKNDVYYIYCQKGITSKKCVDFLRSIGYNVVNVIGGYESYILNSF